MIRALSLAALVLLVALAATTFACNDDDEEEPSPTASPSEATTEPTDGEETATPRTGRGVTDDAIILGTWAPQSGPASTYSLMYSGAAAYMQYVNEEKGGVCGRQVDYRVYDDQYNPTNTVQIYERILEQDKALAVALPFGTLTTSSIIDRTTEDQMPLLYIGTGASIFHQPDGYPFAFGTIPEYVHEGSFLARYVIENMPDVTTIGVLYQNDDFGKDGLNGVEQGAGEELEVVSASYEPADTDLSAQMQSLRDGGAEAVVLFAITRPAALFVKAAEGVGWDVPYLLHSGVTDPLMFQLSESPMEGSIGLQWGKTFADQDDAAVQEFVDKLGQYAPEAQPEISLSAWGWLFGQLLEETLSRACDDLTPEGVVAAAESLEDVELPMLREGITVTMGPDDHSPVECVYYAKAEGGAWTTLDEQACVED